MDGGGSWGGNKGADGPGTGHGTGFVPVVVEPERGAMVPAAPSVIEVIVGPVTVRLDAGVEAAVLKRVLESREAWLKRRATTADSART